MSDEVIAALVGAGAALIVNLIIDMVREHLRRQAHWAALSAEIDYCRDQAEVYLKDKKAAPSYRLPIFTYANSLPPLLASGALDETDTRNLLSFFNEVEAFNRGLDQTQWARQIPEPELEQKIMMINQEYNRNRIKAENILRKYKDAKGTIDKYRTPKTPY
jgi:hypothetical protein